MQQTDQQIIEKFAEIKRKQYIATVPIIIAVILLIISTEDSNFTLFGLENSVLIAMGIVGTLIGLIFSLKNWRCPSCNTYLRKEINPKFCRNCGVRLQD